MSGAGAFVLSSLTEGVSLTILEAMSAGLPVVATRVGGNPEVVMDEETGFLVPPANPEALAVAMVKLWQNPEQRRAMGNAGRIRAEKYFDVRRMVAEYEQLYLEERRSSENTQSDEDDHEAPNLTRAR
jgi:glycosyltransferase involved in cell wall biosynthesis